jgi:hypothetical protein
MIIALKEKLPALGPHPFKVLQRVFTCATPYRTSRVSEMA